MLASAVGDYTFYIGRVKGIRRDFILLPEVLTRRGEAEVRLGRVQDANNSFAEARALKPDYWPAWSHWAEFLISSGKRTEARELVKSGLEYNPNSRVLREQYRLLGGNPSAIVPRAKEQASEPPGSEKTTQGLLEERTAGEATAEAPSTAAPDQ